MKKIWSIVAYLVASAILSVGWYFLKPKPEKGEDERVSQLESVQDKVNKYGDKLNYTASALDDANVGAGGSAAEVLGGEPKTTAPGPGAQNPLSVAQSLKQAQTARAANPFEMEPAPVKAVTPPVASAPPPVVVVEAPPPVSVGSGSDVAHVVDSGSVVPERVPTGPALTVNTTLNGTASAYRVTAAPGWIVYRGSADLDVGIGETLQVTIDTDPNERDNQAYAGKMLTDLSTKMPQCKLKRQEIVTLAQRSWGRFDFSGGAEGGEIIMFTHAGKTGGYVITALGPSEEFKANQQAIVRLISSFRFPPDNLGSRRGTGVRVELPD